jgi:hypothetical protein
MDGEDTKQPAADVGGADSFLEDDDELALGAEKKSTDRVDGDEQQAVELTPFKDDKQDHQLLPQPHANKETHGEGAELGLAHQSIKSNEPITIDHYKDKKKEDYRSTKQSSDYRPTGKDSLIKMKTKRANSINQALRHQSSSLENKYNVNISNDEFESYYQGTHPWNNAKGKSRRFGAFDPLGTLCCCQDCYKSGPSSLARQIKLGPALFLMQTKAFAIFFLFLAIVNIPLCMVFAFGNGELISKAASD